MIVDDSNRASGDFTVGGLPSGKELEMSLVVDGTKSYVSSDAFEGQLPEGKKWMELDFSSALKDTSPSDPAAASPMEGLKVLEHVQGSEKVGEQEIDGVLTTHYRGTLDRSDEAFGVKIDVSAPLIDVWIDSQDRVRREKVDISGSAGGTSSTTAMTIDFIEFGRVPKIEAPPAEEVFDMTSELESQAQSAVEGG